MTDLPPPRPPPLALGRRVSPTPSVPVRLSEDRGTVDVAVNSQGRRVSVSFRRNVYRPKVVKFTFS